MNMDLASLTAEVCRIAMDAGSFLKEERKPFAVKAWRRNTRMTMCRM